MPYKFYCEKCGTTHAKWQKVESRKPAWLVVECMTCGHTIQTVSMDGNPQSGVAGKAASNGPSK